MTRTLLRQGKARASKAYDIPSIPRISVFGLEFFEICPRIFEGPTSLDFVFSPIILLRSLYMCLLDVLCCSLVELRVIKADVYARLEAWIQAANTICGQKEDALKALITET